MSLTVRNMLLNEIESVNTKFGDITSVLNRLTSQATDRMSEAQLIIGEAKKSVDSAEAGTVKKAEAPKADFKPTDAPKAALSDLDGSAPSGAAKADPFATIGGNSYSQGSNGYNANNSSNNKPAQTAPVQEQPKKPQTPKKNNFSFDMEELLKAAEEEAAKGSDS